MASEGREAPKAGEFIQWIADCFVERHTPALAHDRALVLAVSALDAIEQDGATFGHPDFDWTRAGAISIADEEIQHWERVA